MDSEMPYLSPFIFLLLVVVTVIECNNNLMYMDNNINYIKISLEAE